MKRAFVLAVGLILGACSEKAPPTAAAQPAHDVIIRGGVVYDGTGGEPVKADVAIDGDRIAAIGDLKDVHGKNEIDVKGAAVAPGFINMLSWATESLIEDGKGQSDIRQGVTLEVMGEGDSMGPLSDALKQTLLKQQVDIHYDIKWTTLGEYLTYLEKKGISPNVASFIGATTVRENVIGFADRPPTPPELEQMQAQVKQAMEEGAMGVGSSLIYAPAFYAKTDELIALCKVAAQYNGMYISHMRSEGNQLLESVDELIKISREAGLPAEIYHLKAAGKKNWPKMQQVFDKVEAARASGLQITADMYPYTAGATGLDASMPPWVQEGGLDQWVKRLQDPKIRARVIKEMKTDTNAWENLYLAAGPDKIILDGFKNPKLKPLTGRTLADIAKERGKSPEETAMDLVVEDHTRVGTVYFLMSEEEVKQKIARPWVAFGSDESAQAPEGVFLKSNAHPRAYGTFVSVLRYVREDNVIPLQQAIRQLSSLPAHNLKLKDRGELKVGNFADVVVFDPKTVTDHSTFEKPNVYATGVSDVFVNGVQVLRDGEHTGATPGRFVRGPGYKPVG